MQMVLNLLRESNRACLPSFWLRKEIIFSRTESSVSLILEIDPNLIYIVQLISNVSSGLHNLIDRNLNCIRKQDVSHCEEVYCPDVSEGFCSIPIKLAFSVLIQKQTSHPYGLDA